MKEFILRIRVSRAEAADLRIRAALETGGNMSELVRRLIWPPETEPQKDDQHESAPK